MDDDKIILTPKGQVVLKYMQLSAQNVFVGKDLIELTGVKGIYPVLNSLIHKGLVNQSSPIVRDFTNKSGITRPKEYKTYSLTPAGRDYFVE